MLTLYLFPNPFLESVVKIATFFPSAHIPNYIMAIIWYRNNQLNQPENDYNETNVFGRKQYFHNRGL